MSLIKCKEMGNVIPAGRANGKDAVRKTNGTQVGNVYGGRLGTVYVVVGIRGSTVYYQTYAAPDMIVGIGAKKIEAFADKIPVGVAEYPDVLDIKWDGQASKGW